MNQHITKISILIITAAMLASIAGCGSKDQAVATIMPESAPITAEGGEQITIQLGQSITQLELNHQEMEDVMEIREIESTCTRTVQQGTHPVCHLENAQVCRSVQFPVCETIPRRVCEVVQKCETILDQVCRGVPPHQSCTSVPRRSCHAEQSCRTQSSQVCHTGTRQECSTVQNQVCIQVPTQVEEQYACMKPTSIKVGERLKLHQLAQVKLELVNPRHLDVSHDELVVTLNQGLISAVARSTSGIQYQVRETSRVVQRISETEELIMVSLELIALL
jgi:hypothetical protein